MNASEKSKSSDLKDKISQALEKLSHECQCCPVCSQTPCTGFSEFTTCDDNTCRCTYEDVSISPNLTILTFSNAPKITCIGAPYLLGDIALGSEGFDKIKQDVANCRSLKDLKKAVENIQAWLVLQVPVIDTELGQIKDACHEIQLTGVKELPEGYYYSSGDIYSSAYRIAKDDQKLSSSEEKFHVSKTYEYSWILSWRGNGIQSPTLRKIEKLLTLVDTKESDPSEFELSLIQTVYENNQAVNTFYAPIDYAQFNYEEAQFSIPAMRIRELYSFRSAEGCFSSIVLGGHTVSEPEPVIIYDDEEELFLDENA